MPQILDLVRSSIVGDTTKNWCGQGGPRIKCSQAMKVFLSAAEAVVGTAKIERAQKIIVRIEDNR